MKVSQSTLGAADKCMLSAQYSIDTPVWFKRTAGSERLTGTGYHAGAEAIYRARLNGLPDPSLADVVAQGVEAFDQGCLVDAYDNTPVERVIWSERVPDVAKGHELIGVMLTEYVEGGHTWPLDWEVLAVEYVGWFDVPAPESAHPGAEVKVKLGADLILRDPVGYVVEVDHKTANKKWDEHKHSPRKNNQAPLYTATAKLAFPGAPGYRFVFDIMQYPNTKSGPRFERRISDPSPAHEAAVLKKARDFAAMYTLVHVDNGLDLPANPASTLCNPKWCDYFDGCPHGAVLELAA